MFTFSNVKCLETQSQPVRKDSFGLICSGHLKCNWKNEVNMFCNSISWAIA